MCRGVKYEIIFFDEEPITFTSKEAIDYLNEKFEEKYLGNLISWNIFHNIVDRPQCCSKIIKKLIENKKLIINKIKKS